MLPRLASSAAVIGAATSFQSWKIAKCSEDHVHCVEYPFPQYGLFSSFDAASIRRGFQVYRQVCSSCHSINQISFRQLVGVSHTEEQMKAIAASYDIVDASPDDAGEPVERPGKLSDKIPAPYKNEEQARSANNGALPPDLSLMVKARHDGANYVFSLMNGYIEAPAGKVVPAGLHYNPYFPGAQIAMSKQLSDGQVEYEDGTPATEAQMAKDVACFLAWTAEPEHDFRKMIGVSFVFGIFCLAVLGGFHKRFRWAPVKTRKLFFIGDK